MSSVNAGSGASINAANAQGAEYFSDGPLTPEEASVVASSHSDADTIYDPSDPYANVDGSGLDTAVRTVDDLGSAPIPSTLDLLAQELDAYTGDPGVSDAIVAQFQQEARGALGDSDFARLVINLGSDPAALSETAQQLYASYRSQSTSATSPTFDVDMDVQSLDDVQAATTEFAEMADALHADVLALTGNDQQLADAVMMQLVERMQGISAEELQQLARALATPETRSEFARQLVADYEARGAAGDGAGTSSTSATEPAATSEPAQPSMHPLMVAGGTTLAAGGTVAAVGAYRHASRANAVAAESAQFVDDLEHLARRGGETAASYDRLRQAAESNKQSLVAKRQRFNAVNGRLAALPGGSGAGSLVAGQRKEIDLLGRIAAKERQLVRVSQLGARAANASDGAVDILRAMDTDSSRAALQRLGLAEAAPSQPLAIARQGVLEGIEHAGGAKAVQNITNGIDRFAVNGGGLLKAGRLPRAGGIAAAIGATALIGGMLLSNSGSNAK